MKITKDGLIRMMTDAIKLTHVNRDAVDDLLGAKRDRDFAFVIINHTQHGNGFFPDDTTHEDDQDAQFEARVAHMQRTYACKFSKEDVDAMYSDAFGS
jgi:hypothetical protein